MLNLHSVNNQKGIVHYLIILLVVLGIGVAVFLSQKTQIFSPKAQETLNNVSSSQGTLSTSPSSEKLMMVNYKFTNPGDKKVVARVRVAVSDLKAKIGLLAAYYGFTSNLHYTGQLVNYYPAKSPFDPNWSWTVDPATVTASEVTDPSCYMSPNDIERWFKLPIDRITLEQIPDLNKWCIQSSDIESIEGVKSWAESPETANFCPDEPTVACLNNDQRICLTFSSSCHFPSGWAKKTDIQTCKGGDCPGQSPSPDTNAAEKRDQQRIQDLKKIHDALITYKKDHNSFCLKGNGTCSGTSPFTQYMYDPKLGNINSKNVTVESALSRYLYPIPSDPLVGSGQTVRLGDKILPFPNYLVVMYNDGSFVLSARLEVTKPENKNCVPQDAPLVNYCINQE